LLAKTNELARNPASTGLIGRELQRSLARTVDTSALATIIAAGTSTPTLGGTVPNLISDLQSMFIDVEIGEQSRLYFVLNSALAVGLSARLAGSVGWELTPTGGRLAGVDVVVSNGAPIGSLILLDASRFAGYSDTITLDASEQATLQMNTAPDSPPTASTPLLSLWQHDMVALRATRWWGIQNLTSTAAATTTGMS
jgi:hypothetical protein